VAVKASITPKDMVDLLNEALGIDHRAVSLVVKYRVYCNRALLEHPTIQVAEFPADFSNTHYPVEARNEVGFLGILNGAFGIFEEGPNQGSGPIACEIDEDTGQIIRFLLVPQKE
jgi:hypothetical protein